MEATGKDYSTSRRKVCIFSCHQSSTLLILDQALTRDGYRCMITGMFDDGSLKRSAALRKIAKIEGANGVTIHACHILNESTTQGIDPEGNTAENKVRCHPSALSPSFPLIIQTHYAAGAMALLESFGFSHFTEAFKQKGGVHEVWNLLTLDSHLHAKFDCLDLWFERTGQVCHPEIRQPHRLTGCTAKPLQYLLILRGRRGIYPPQFCPS